MWFKETDDPNRPPVRGEVGPRRWITRSTTPQKDPGRRGGVRPDGVTDRRFVVRGLVFLGEDRPLGYLYVVPQRPRRSEYLCLFNRVSDLSEFGGNLFLGYLLPRGEKDRCRSGVESFLLSRRPVYTMNAGVYICALCGRRDHIVHLPSLTFLRVRLGYGLHVLSVSLMVVLRDGTGTPGVLTLHLFP